MDKAPRGEKTLADAIRSAIIIGRVAIAALWATILFSVPSVGEELIAKSQPLNCDIGPVSQTYGMTQWMVYSCNDQRTIVIVSAPGNPAMPYYFMIFPGDDGYQLVGEGTGPKGVAAVVFEELKALSESDFAALIERTMQL